MSRLKTRDGAVLLTIKGVSLLVCDKEARRYCRYMWEINEPGALIWKCMEDHLSFEEIAERMMDEYDIEDRSVLEADIRTYLDQLVEQGYLIAEDTNDVL